MAFTITVNDTVHRVGVDGDAAIMNAIYAATGKRLRKLPVKPAELKDAKAI